METRIKWSFIVLTIISIGPLMAIILMPSYYAGEQQILVTTLIFIFMGFGGVIINTVSEAAKGWPIPWIMDSINKFTLLQCGTVGITILWLTRKQSNNLNTIDIMGIMLMLLFLLGLFIFQVAIYHLQKKLNFAFCINVLSKFLCAQKDISNEDKEMMKDLAYELIEVDFKPISITNLIEGEKKRNKRILLCKIINLHTKGDSRMSENDLLLPSKADKLTTLQKSVDDHLRYINRRNILQFIYGSLAVLSIIVFAVAMYFLARFQISAG